MKEKGKLFLCATPIGNLEDVTLRLIKTLQAVEAIAAEDTSHTRKLLNHLGIQKRLISYYEHNKDKKGPELINMLEEGQNIALVSDAGYPGISDPGEQLVALAVASDIAVVPIPGANAALCALIASGVQTTPFFFGGFLPKTKKHREEKLRMWQSIPATVILYEAPHRIKQVLAEIKDLWGERQVALARELTKMYEEFYRGSVSDCLAWLESKPPRGEFTLVIEQGEAVCEDNKPEISARVRLQQLLAQGEDKKESLKKVAKEYGIAKRDLYKELLDSESMEEE